MRNVGSIDSPGHTEHALGVHAAQRIRGTIQPYAWGSRTAIAELTGRVVPSDGPEAELWLGAHPAAPSELECGALLDGAIAAAPIAALGQDCVERFGPRLPFLLKVLAAESALSLQAHPTLAQARAGYARENAVGIALDAPLRNYRDDNHKPELLVALTEFHALAGFREVASMAAILRAFDVPELSACAARIENGCLRSVFDEWLALEQSAAGALLDSVVHACRRYLHDTPGGEFVDEACTVLDLAEQYPGDPGVLASPLLNRIRLEPGDGIYLDAGHLHAYLRGVGVEIMANSDNVLRGGLTGKHVDRHELARVLVFEPIAPPIVSAQPVRDGESSGILQYPTPAREFRLRRADLARDGAGCLFSTSEGPQIYLCTAGACRLNVDGAAGRSHLRADRGESIWVSAGHAVHLDAETEHAQVFIATVP